MMQSLRLVLRRAGLALARTVGARLIDSETGESLGRVLVIPWRGKIHLIGMSKPVRAKFIHQARVTYWKQELGFALHPPPDFPRVREAPAIASPVTDDDIHGAEISD